jgi:dTDP-4-amino-4,6-dideoxygalactose transaminase
MGKNQKRIFLSPPHMGGEELKFIQQAFKSNYIAPVGPMVDAFEKAFSEKVGIPYCLALSSGTAAMHLAMRQLGIRPGDEVFASTLTFIGSVSPIVFQGATPVFIDSSRLTWTMDPDLLAGELERCANHGRLPKAVVPTDIYGQCADYGQIFSMCERYEVPVIVDAAEAMGSYYRIEDKKLRREEEKEKKTEDRRQKSEDRGQITNHNSQHANFHHAGVGAKAAVYSFNGNKIITTSGGGMLASDDKKLIDHARKLSQQARENFIHYEHKEIGYNYRMSNIIAAIGMGQLKVLDDRVEKKRRIFDYYQQAFENVPGIDFITEAPYMSSNRWLTVILINPEEFGADREAVVLALEGENIESRPIWKPMHMQPVFQVAGRKAQGARRKAEDKIKARAVDGEVAEDLFNRGLCLPSGTAMTEEDLDRVIDVIMNCSGAGTGSSSGIVSKFHGVT